MSWQHHDASLPCCSCGSAYKLPACGARRHDEEDCGYINASHLRSKDFEQPEWDYIAAQARSGLHARNKDMKVCMRMGCVGSVAAPIMS